MTPTLGDRPARRPQGPRPRRRGGGRARRGEHRARAGLVHRDHGAVGLGQEHVPARGGGAGPADLRHRRARGDRAGRAQRAAADDPAARADRVRLPGVQPAAVAHGRPEHRPAAAPGRAPRRGARRSARSRRGSGWTTACAIVPRSSPAASSSGSRSPGRWSPGPRSCSPTSRPERWTRAPGAGVLALLREVVDGDGHTVVMVTHDPAAAAHADRVVLLADGRLAGMLEAPERRRGRRAARAAGELTMLRLALLSGRGRLSTFTGALVALAVSAALVVAGGMPFEAALRAHPPVERYAGAAAVVTGQQIVGADHDVPLGERARVDAALAGRLAAVPGVRAAIGDVSVPARLGGRDTAAHGWSSAALTPYVLSAGRAPAAARRGRHRLPRRARRAAAPRVHGGRPAPSPSSASPGPRHPVRQRPAIFLTDAEATRLAGHPGRVDAIGVLAAPGFDAARLRAVTGGAVVLTGDARGRGEYPELQAGADHADRRHRGVRRPGAVHRDLRRGRHDGPVDPAARARDRAAARGGRDAGPDPPHDRLGGGDRRPGGLGARALAGSRARPRARGGARAPRHRPAEPRRQRRLAADRGGRRRRRRSPRCWPSSPPGGAPRACRRRRR